MLSLIELEPVPPEWKSLARTLQLVQVVVLLVRTQLVQLVVSLEQKPLRQPFRSSQDVLPLPQLYQLQHQLQEEFRQLVKEFQYQPCR
jgi:hypothetical protein